MRLRADVLGGDEIVRQLVGCLLGIGLRIGVDQLTIGEQLIREDIHLLLALLPLTNHVARIHMREAGLDAVTGIIGQRQRDGTGRRNRTVVGKAAPLLCHRGNQLRLLLRHLLHIAAVLGMEHLAQNPVADTPAISDQLGTLTYHILGDLERLIHHRGCTLLLRQFDTGLPAGDRQLLGHHLGELEGIGCTILHPQHGHGGAETEEAHTVAALAHDLVTLLFQRQTVDLDHVIQHAGEDAYRLAVGLPVKGGVLGERLLDKAGEVDGAQQAGTVRRQRLLTTRVGGTHHLIEPVVVHLIDLVDEDEAGLGVVVGGGHDHIP